MQPLALQSTRKWLPAALTVLLIAAPLSVEVQAEDWPQWRGPDRDGKSAETGLLDSWPEAGPELLWQTQDLGDGYGAPSVVDGVIYLITNEGLETESVKALDAKDGSERWSTPIGKVGNPDQRPNYPAARSTPTVVGDLLYALGSDGDLACLEIADGNIRWQKNLRSAFDGKPGEWAYAESPLVDGDRIITAPGSEDAALVALDRHTGETIWQATVPDSEAAGYASIITVTADGVKQYVAFLGLGLVGVEAETGKFLWLYEQTKGTANSPTPVAKDRFVYSGSGRTGGGLVRLSATSDGVDAEEVYFSPKLPKTQGGFILHEDYLYGGGGSTLLCVDFQTGEPQWEERIPASGSICYADGKLYVHAENGEMLLVEASPEAYRELGRFSPPDQPDRGRAKAWAYPVIADGRLYLRDRGTLWCYQIR